jgi:hypothetical protein
MKEVILDHFVKNAPVYKCTVLAESNILCMRQAWIQGVYAELLFANDREIFESGKY